MKKLTIENRIENLAKAAEFVEMFGEEFELDQKSVFEINLILDELITNIVSYGYKDNGTHLIEIILEKNDNYVHMQITDDGEEFNPLEAKEVDINKPLEEKKIGGLGIHFVKQKSNNISYRRENSRNILSITKKLGTAGEKNGN